MPAEYAHIQLFEIQKDKAGRETLKGAVMGATKPFVWLSADLM